MNILFFNWRDRLHPEAGGAEENLHEIGKRLVEKGYEVSLICGSFKGCDRELMIDKMKVYRVGGRFSVYLFAPLKYWFGKFKPDIIVDDINGIPFLSPLFSRKPVVAIFHHRVGKIFEGELSFPFSRIGLFIEDHLMPRVYKKKPFITVSESSRTELIELGLHERNIKIVHNGVNTEHYTPCSSRKSEKPTLLYLGRLKLYKRVDILIRSMVRIGEFFPDVTLNIVGKGDDEDRLKKMVMELNLSDKVKFHGFVDERKKLDMLQSSWLMLIPSEKEGWGITALEANACGTPVIAFDVPGLRDSVKNGYSGILCDNEVEFRDAVIDQLKEKDQRERLSANARDWSLKFQWDKSADEFINVMKSL